jgi:hypothetical protein
MKILRHHTTSTPWPRHHIPRTLIQTTGAADLPKGRLHRHFTDGLQWHLFNDTDLLKYLAKRPSQKRAPFNDTEFDQHLAKRVRHLEARLPMGPHKADLFRYYRLWREGGVYADVKTRFTTDAAAWLFSGERHALPTVYAVRGDRRACPESGAHLYNGFLAAPARSPVLRAFLEDLLEHLESNRPPAVCADGQCGANGDYTRFLRFAWRRLELLFPGLRQSSDDEGGVFHNEHSRLVLLEERCFAWRKTFAFQPAECRGFEGTDRYGRCCNAYLRNGPTQRVEGAGRCGGGLRVFAVRDETYNGTAFDAARVPSSAAAFGTPLPPSELVASGAAMCDSCHGDPVNERTLISGERPVGFKYTPNRAECTKCPPMACGR